MREGPEAVKLALTLTCAILAGFLAHLGEAYRGQQRAIDRADAKNRACFAHLAEAKSRLRARAAPSAPDTLRPT